MKPPIADKIDSSFILHGQKIIDEYAWLRDSEWPNVNNKKIIEYLQAENKHTEQFFLPLQQEKDKIFKELKGRIKLDDQSTYIKKNNYYYYTKTEQTTEYPIYCRKKYSMDANEEIILDVNVIAKGNKFTNIGLVTVSPDHMLMAYSVDFTGDEQYIIRVHNLKTKEYLLDELNNVNGKIIWHENLKGFFYMPVNKNFRHDKLVFHFLGDLVANDKLVFHITNSLYQLNVTKSASGQYIFINVYGHNENEVYALQIYDYSFHLKLIRALKEGIFYDVEHNSDNFYIKTNEGARNFHVVIVNINNYQNDLWKNIYVPEDYARYLLSFAITTNYLILNYLDQGLPIIKIKHLKGENKKVIHLSGASFIAYAMSTNFDEDDIRVNYSSLAKPHTTYSYDFDSDQLSILKVQEIPSGFKPEEYMVERIFTDSDGVKVPITLLYKKSLFKKDGRNPLYLYGYGSYGISIPVSFRNTAISLVDRGFVYVIAHIRGGNDLGHDWYKAAKFLSKKRTFNDFIAVSKELIKQQYTSQGNIVICGGSAGGLLIGVVINEQPQLFRAALAHVPFVDVLNTMLDEQLPLTPGEFKEWGNPKKQEYFNYIRSYSPYDNIKSQNYPNLFVTAGIYDLRVGYWEAAKWVARIRAMKLDNNRLLLKTNMGSGHNGPSSRFDYLKDAADDIVFILKVTGIIN